MLKTLRSKIIFSFLLIEAIIVLLLILTFNFVVVNQLREQLINEIKNEINIIEFSLLNTDLEKFGNQIDYLNKLSSQLNYRIILLDINKKALYDFNEKIVDSDKDIHSLRTKSIGKFNYEFKENKVTGDKFIFVTKNVSILIGNNKTSINYITIASNINSIERFAADIRFRIVFYSLLIFLGGLFAIRYFTSKVTNPINKIVEALKEYSKTGIPQKIQLQGSEEFKFLIESINGLMHKIESDFNELKKLEKYRSEFLGNVSHELRTPIFAIQTYLETLIDGGVNDPEINIKYLKKAYEHLERLNLLLRDLIDISQIEAKQLRLSFRFLNLNDIIDKVIEDIKLLAEQKETDIIFQKDDELKELVWADKERLQQILFNLIENAIRHNPDKTQVKIYYKKMNSTVRIFVEDNGIGIPEEDLPRIFERFYRVNKERSRESGGTGLGLSIVKHLVEAHGSKIFVESKKGIGTKFYFDLKIA